MENSRYKFRAWSPGIKSETITSRKQYGEWLFPPQMLYDDKPGDCLVWKNQGQTLEIMQYIGFKDCDGKEIYERDILSSGNSDYVVVWSPEHAQFFFSVINTKTTLVRNLKFPVFQYAIDGVCGVEVIGNIYENPELLGEIKSE